MLFVDKYAPKSTSEMVGNEKAISTVKIHVLNWLHGKAKKPVLVYGPPGVGKTLLAYALANDLNLSVVEINASDIRDKKGLESIFSSAKNSMTLFGQKRIILIDDVDALSPVDRGAVGEILKLIKTSKFPIILTANDAWVRKISKIRLKCTTVQFRRINSASIQKYLKKIVEAEHLAHSPIANKLPEISKNADGDMRAAINDLQSGISFKRDITENIFNTVRTIFKSTSYTETSSAIRNSESDLDIIMLWIDENIPLEYTDADDINRAYYWLSLGYLYMGRIQSRNYWGYLRYVFDFVSSGVALSKKSVYRKFTKYAFPTYLSAMSRSMAIRSLNKSVGKKISLIMHTNRKDALMFLVVLKYLINKTGSKSNSKLLEHIKDYYEFSDAEIEYISSISPEVLYI